MPPSPPLLDSAPNSGPVWSTAPRHQRWAALDGDGQADLCVVGLGYSGLAAVGAALDAGATVIGLDAGLVASGAAGANGGFLLAGLALFHHEAVARLGAARARGLYQATLDELDRMGTAASPHVRRTGSLRIADSAGERADCAAHASALQSDGFRVSPYEGPEGAGIMLPDDGTCDPLARALAAAETVVARGARLHERTAAGVIRPGRVSTPQGEVRCGAVVVAVDGGLEELLPDLSGRVRTTRLQMLATAPLDYVLTTRPVYARYGYEYYQQLPDGRVALGGFRDRHQDAEWAAPAETSAGVQRDLETFLRERLAVQAPITHRWAARAAYTEDRLPVLEEWAPRVQVSGAYSGVGNILGALCARAATARLLGGDDPLDGLL